MAATLRRIPWLRIVALSALLGATAWTVTRSDALPEAETAYRVARDPNGYAEALRKALAHLDRQPWSLAASRVAARCLSKLDRPDLAEPHWNRVEPLDRDDAMLRADGLLRSNRREAALAAFRAIQERWPEDVEAARRLTGLFYVMSRYDEAIAAARRLAVLPGSEPEARSMIGSIYHETGLPGAAADEAIRLLEIDPGLRAIPPVARMVFWHDLATDLLAEGRASEAKAWLLRAGAQLDEPRLKLLLGTACRQLGEFDEARQAWRAAAESPEIRATALRELGLLELSRPGGSAEEALATLRAAEALVPDDPPLLYGIQNALTRLDRKAEALEVNARRARLLRAKPPPPRGMGASMAPPSPAENRE